MTLDMARLYSDDKYFCENLIQIEDRDRNLISFKFNPAQEILYKNGTNRDIVVKAGQMGISTWYLASNFKETITKPGTTSVIVAHEEFLTQRLLSRTKYWYDMMPKIINTDLGPIEKPERVRNSANETTFPAINSVFYIGTARAFVFGRGEPIHRFQGSEVAFWPDPWRILTPTMQRVPLETGNMVLESTPNGEGNAFHELVMEAMEDFNSIWHLHEIYWWMEPVYRIKKGAKEALKSDQGNITLTDEELSIVKIAGWTDDIEIYERIRWRRRKISEIKNEFFQEFMESITSCFLFSGSRYYDEDEVARLVYSRSPEIATWKYKTKIWNYPDDDWESPNYIISVDPGQGKVTESVATVWRIDPTLVPYSIRHEATLAGMYESVTFAKMVIDLANYYKMAKIAPERNGHGQAFCAQVKDYVNLYRQTDIVSGVSTKVIGWATTGAAVLDGRGTKTYMMDRLDSLLPSIECHDESIINQIAQVKIEGDGKFVFPKMDDKHDAVAIMAATHNMTAGMVKRGFAFSKGWKRL